MHLRRLFMGAVLAVLCSSTAIAQEPAPPGSEVDPRIEKLVSSISEERLRALLTKLVSFKTRNLFSDPAATDGIGAARQWILDELKKTSPKLQVSFDVHTSPAGGRVPREVELRNVLAILPGKTPRRIYVSGHYDSLNLGQRGQQGLNTGAARGTGGGA